MNLFYEFGRLYSSVTVIYIFQKITVVSYFRQALDICSV